MHSRIHAIVLLAKNPILYPRLLWDEKKSHIMLIIADLKPLKIVRLSLQIVQ